MEISVKEASYIEKYALVYQEIDGGLIWSKNPKRYKVKLEKMYIDTDVKEWNLWSLIDDLRDANELISESCENY